MTKSEVVDTMKNADLREKVGNYDYEKKISIKVMSNITPKTMTHQQRYYEKKRRKVPENGW